DEGVIHIPAEVPPGATPGATLAASAAIVDSRDRSHPVGATAITVAGLSIDGPETVHEHSVVVSGRAPAGSLVTIAERDVPLGMAVAGPSGRWQTRIDLPERPVGSSYSLHASSDDAGVESTEPIDI